MFQSCCVRRSPALSRCRRVWRPAGRRAPPSVARAPSSCRRRRCATTSTRRRVWSWAGGRRALPMPVLVWLGRALALVSGPPPTGRLPPRRPAVCSDYGCCRSSMLPLGMVDASPPLVGVRGVSVAGQDMDKSLRSVLNVLPVILRCARFSRR